MSYLPMVGIAIDSHMWFHFLVLAAVAPHCELVTIPAPHSGILGAVEAALADH
jgi:hypothetical protein